MTMQIPIECPLSALRYKTFGTSEKFLTIAQLLYMFTKDYSNVVIQGTFPAIIGASTDYTGSSWLAKKIYTSLFTDENMSNLEVLQNLCTFFGWTARSGKDSLIDQGQDNSVYFIKNRNTDYVGRRDLYVLGQSQLNANTPTGTKLSGWQEQTFPEEGMADTKAELILFEGIKSASVECQINDFNFDIDVMGEAFTEAVQQWQQTKIETVTTPCNIPTYYWSQIDEMAGGWRFQGDNTVAGISKHGSQDMKDWENYILIVNTAKTDVQHQVPGESGSMETDYYEVLTYYEGALTMTKTTDTEFNSKGILTLNFNLYTSSPWSDYVKFYLHFISGQNVFKYDPTTQTWDAQGSEKVCVTDTNGKFEAFIPVNMPGEATSPKGKIEIVIYKVNGSGIMFKGFSLDFKIKSDNVIDSSINTITHSAESGVGFSDTVSFDSMLCVKEELMQNSYNVLLNNDNTKCEELVDSTSPYTTPFNPLQRLVDEAATEGQNIGEMLKMNIRRETASGDISPLTVFEMPSMDEMYYPAVISYDVRDDVTQMKLIKRRYNEEY